MLNRRYLRIKVFQSLYAYWQNEDATPSKVEKELFLSIDRTYDLYVALLDLIGEVRRKAEQRIEERKAKRLPTGDDLEPSRRFVDNPVMLAISNSARLATESRDRKVEWVGEGELVGRIYRAFAATEEYNAYMTAPSTRFKIDQQLVLHLFLEHIANSEALHDLYDARSIHWMEDLDLASSMVKRTIETMREGHSGELHFDDLDRDRKEERDFVAKLYRKTIEMGEEHEDAIAEKAKNWETDRIALSDMILMKMALTEARVFEEIPVKVTLNEYIEIAKAYSTPKSKNFVNGILDKLFIEMRANGSIHKVGRGLLEN